MSDEQEIQESQGLDVRIVVALIGLFGVIGAALIAVYLPTIINGPTPTLTPTAMPTPLPPPSDGNVGCELIGGAEICAWVSDSEPLQYSKVIVYGRLQIDGVPQVDMPMITKWHYESGPKLGEPPKTDIRGTASCERSIGPATVGYQVNVDVEIGDYKVTTWFTPQASPQPTNTPVLPPTATDTPRPNIQATITEGFRLYPVSVDSSEISVAKNESVTLVAISSDGEWLLLERSDGKRGWGKRLHVALDLDDDLNRLPSLLYTPPPIAVGASLPSYRLVANGDAENIFALEMESLAIGTSELTYPAVMNLGEDAFVELIIRPDIILASLSQSDPSPLPPPVEVSEPAISLFESMVGITNTIDYRTDYGREIRIFPVMYAELKASEDSFRIVAETELRRTIDLDKPVRWRWIVTPRASGPRSLILTIYIPATVDGRLEILETRELASFPIHVEVLVTPTPTVTETATPTLFKRSGESLAANFNTIVAAFISLVGAIIAAIITAIYGPMIVEQWGQNMGATMLQEPDLNMIKNTDDLTQLKALLHDERENPRECPTVIAAIQKQIKEVQNSSKSES